MKPKQPKKPKRKIFRYADHAKHRTLATFNGVIGHTLEQTGLFSIPMTIYSKGGEDVSQNPKKFRDKKICLLVHGSCGSERDWNFKRRALINYGTMLEADLGVTPYYVRYNSGLHISTNGKRLSHLLELWLGGKGSPVEEIILLGHSMGGLVHRSACHYAVKDKRLWVKQVSKMFYLGSPHLGTHLEKAGKLTTSILTKIPNITTHLIAWLGDMRSDGIKDLRHGFVTDDDWQSQRGNHLLHFPTNRPPLLGHAQHFLVGSTILKNADSKMARLIGDGLVPVDSALGRSFRKAGNIPLIENSTSKIFAGVSHLDLARDMKVYRQIREWCHNR